MKCEYCETTDEKDFDCENDVCRWCALINADIADCKKELRKLTNEKSKASCHRQIRNLYFNIELRAKNVAKKAKKSAS